MGLEINNNHRFNQTNRSFPEKLVEFVGTDESLRREPLDTVSGRVNNPLSNLVFASLGAKFAAIVPAFLAEFLGSLCPEELLTDNQKKLNLWQRVLKFFAEQKNHIVGAYYTVSGLIAPVFSFSARSLLAFLGFAQFTKFHDFEKERINCEKEIKKLELKLKESKDPQEIKSLEQEISQLREKAKHKSGLLNFWEKTVSLLAFSATVLSIVGARKGTLLQHEEYQDKFVKHLPKTLESSINKFDKPEIFDENWKRRVSQIEDPHDQIGEAVNQVFRSNRENLVSELRISNPELSQEIDEILNQDRFEVYKIEEIGKLLQKSGLTALLATQQRYQAKAREEADKFIELINNYLPKNNRVFSIDKVRGTTENILLGQIDQEFKTIADKALLGIEKSKAEGIFKKSFDNLLVEFRKIFKLLEPKQISKEIEWFKSSEYQRLKEGFERNFRNELKARLAKSFKGRDLEEKLEKEMSNSKKNFFYTIQENFYIFNQSSIGTYVSLGVLLSRLFSVSLFSLYAQQNGTDQFASSQYLTDEEKKKKLESTVLKLAKIGFSTSQLLNVGGALAATTGDFVGVTFGSIAAAANLYAATDLGERCGGILEKMGLGALSAGAISSGLSVISRDIGNLATAINNR